MRQSSELDALRTGLGLVSAKRYFGRVAAVEGLTLEVDGVSPFLAIGGELQVAREGRGPLPCEVVGFRDGRAVCLPFGPMEGVRLGAEAEVGAPEASIRPSRGWLGRVVDGLGEPIDGKGPLPAGPVHQPLRASPPSAHTRARVGERIDLGVRALNAFATCCRGQRMGIFAGSGVGKSVLLSMLARYSQADVAVIGLIGERGREVQEFIEDDLGAEGLSRSVVVVATSDEPALRRRQAAYLTMTLAEYFRDQNAHVLCLIDSITRFAMAQREIGLSAGEPPTTKGYTPTVFAELPRLLERAGPGAGAGAITGLFTVLVDGDDHNEPIADAVRGILDGHIVMERAIAERGRYPAINILKSVSRTMPGCLEPEEAALVREARGALATYADMEDLIRVGAYRQGTDADVDRAIALNGPLEAFLAQEKSDHTDVAGSYERLRAILAGDVS